ncbi:MAG: hypothetical protein NC906_08155 [Candidatus Omnitrophica bacterium]|nr:hypothetical protein [Candidatus Omnitrophota bacterium]
MVKSNLDRRIGNSLQIVAHRGFSGLYPENTLLAIKKALELDVDFIEVDVRETKDKELVIMHDEKIDRTTDGKGFVKEIAFSELRKYDAGRWKGFPGEKVPHLKEVLETLDKKTGLLIEIKECDIENLLKCIEKFQTGQHLFIGSFSLDYVKKVRSLFSELPTTYITSNVPDNLKELIATGIRKLDIHYKSLDSKVVKKLVASGFLVNTWTPDEEKDLISCIDMGVQFITTNRPDTLKKIIKMESKNDA